MSRAARTANAHSPQPMNRLLSRLPIAFFAALAPAAFVWGADPNPPIVRSRAGADGERDLATVVFDPRHRAVLSAEVSATVVRVFKEMGQELKAGAPLIELDAETYQVQAEKAEALLASATAQFEAMENLFKDNSVSSLEFERAKKDLVLARADLRLVQKQLAACTIRGPYDGRLVKALVNEHELVDRGQELLEIVDDRTLLARFLVPSSALGNVRIGQKVQIAVIETKTDVEGIVSHVGAVMEPASGTVEILAEVGNSKGLLRCGMTGRVAVPERKDPRTAE